MLPHSEWLDRAKRLSIGMHVRVQHRNERRPNMVIGNDNDKWWAYCQACKEGGVMPKEHVLLNSTTKHEPVLLTIPTDIKPVLGSEFEQAIGKFLASKHMMFPYLPTLYYSEQARRLLIQDDNNRWHGRDLTDRSPAKWLHYGASYSGTVCKNTIITEDMFSMWKVQFALKDTLRKGWGVFCTLGTSVSQPAALQLKEAGRLIWAYDGDAAGYVGANYGRRRMQVFVDAQSRARPPEGLDPKDMDCQAIRDLMRSIDQ